MIAEESFFTRLTRRSEAVNSLLCVGLDPHPELLESPTAEAASEFCLRLIESTAGYACAFKPNSAFFEGLGAPGWAALAGVIDSVPDGIPVILDAKRSDVASSAYHYARAAFEALGVDAVTVNPYLGHDSVEPFVRDPAHGAFLLCKTSNPDAEDIQLLTGDGVPVFLQVARLATEWNELDNIGLVVGATDPAAIAQVRQVAPEMWILAPGVGPQGADPKVALEAGLRQDGLGVVLSVSRSIATGSDPAEVAARYRDSMNRIRGSSTLPPRHVKISKPVFPRTLGDELLDAGCVKFGDFELKSGERSPIYFDLRLLAGRPKLLSRVAAMYLPILDQLKFDRLAAVPYAGMPIATAVSLQSGRPMIYPRKEVKEYGTKAAIEGGFEPGERAVLIDDLATSGGSKLEAAAKLKEAGLEVRDVVVLIDREGGAAKLLQAAGLQLHAVFALSVLIEHWRANESVDPELLDRIAIDH